MFVLGARSSAGQSRSLLSSWSGVRILPGAPFLKIMEQCKRCARCCLTSPPSLHLEDKSLITSQKIFLESVLTYRRGEIVFDHSLHHYVSLERELIKVRQSQTGCIYLQENKCRIYAFRPLECKSFFCASPDNLLAIKGCNLLSRVDIIEDEELKEIVLAHEKLCSLDRVKKFLQAKSKDELFKLIGLDEEFRLYLQEKRGIYELNFYLGRPLKEIIGEIKPFLT